MILFSRSSLAASLAALTIVATPLRALAADAGDDSGINDSGITTVPSEGGKLVDASTSSSSGDPSPPVEEDGGCAVSARAGSRDAWAAYAVLASAGLAAVLRARRRNK
jgi:hypothetical protein